MTDPRDEAWWRSGVGRRSTVALAALVVMFALSLNRMVSAFETDALAIAMLTGLLLWTHLQTRRQAQRLNDKLDLLAIRLRYGPLTADDLETIRVLRSGTGAARRATDRARRTWLAGLFRCRRLASQTRVKPRPADEA